MKEILFSLSAFAALLPAALLGLRRDWARDSLYWAATAVAVAGPMAWVSASLAGGWSGGLGMALWITVASTMAAYLVVVATAAHAWRLTPLVAGYMACFGFIASFWDIVGGVTPQAGAAVQGNWILIHVAISVATYALATLAALAAFAAFLQERALKTKKPTAFTRQLPSVADAEHLVVRLLTVGEIVLGAGLVTGMAGLYARTGAILAFDHKTILSLAAFALIGSLLIAHHRSGVRGRRAARLVLLSYLLLTLGYLGVKFVTEVLLA